MISLIGQQIIDLRLQKKSLKEIRKILGCSSSTVSKYCSMIKSNEEIKEEIHSQRYLPNPHEVSRRKKAIQQQVSPGQNPIASLNKLRRTAFKYFLIQPAKGQCQHCGYHKSFSSLSFHHIDPLTKRFGIAGPAFHKYSIETLIIEASKCLLLCSNCHHETHDELLELSHLSPLDFTQITVPENIIEWYLEKNGESWSRTKCAGL